MKKILTSMGALYESVAPAEMVGGDIAKQNWYQEPDDLTAGFTAEKRKSFMELDLFDLAQQNLTLLLFLVIGIGYLIGNIKTFGQLEITNRFGCFIPGINRASIELPYDDNILVNVVKSPLPALSYAGTYPFANVLLTFAGTFLMTL